MKHSSPVKTGEISEAVISALGVQIKPGTPVFIGQTNINHIMRKHKEDFAKYGEYINDIINRPDYVGINPANGSIEYIKEYVVNNDFVKIAIRVSRHGRYFIRSMYLVNTQRVLNFIKSGTLKPLL